MNLKPYHYSMMKINEGNRLRILYFLVFCCTASWLPIFADYLKDRGLSGIKIGIILSITPFMMFLVQPVYGMFADRLGYKKCLLWSTALATISYTGYLVHGGFLYLFAVTVCMAVFYNGIQPVLDSLSLSLVQKRSVILLWHIAHCRCSGLGFHRYCCRTFY